MKRNTAKFYNPGNNLSLKEEETVWSPELQGCQSVDACYYLYNFHS